LAASSKPATKICNTKHQKAKNLLRTKNDSLSNS